MNEKIKDKKGFTIMELLIVIAMIVVLVGLYIPTFSGQTEKAREAVDLAAARSAISAVKNSYMLGEAVNGATPDKNMSCYYKQITAQQKKMKWQSYNNKSSMPVGGVNLSAAKTSDSGTKLVKKWTIKCYVKDVYSEGKLKYKEGQLVVSSST